MMPAKRKKAKIEIAITDKTVKIFLHKGKAETDHTKFAEDFNLSEKLLPQIDRLLKKNKIGPEDVKKVTVKTDAPESFTTSRIARTVSKLWNWGSL